MSLLSLVQAIPLISNAFGQKKYANNVANAYNAIDPSSPQFQRIYSQEQQAGKDNLAFQIAELQRQNRKSAMLGRTPLLSPERGGETIFRGLNQGQQDTESRSRLMTYDLLGKRAAAQPTIAEMQRRADLDRDYYGYGGIAEALRGLFNLG